MIEYSYEEFTKDIELLLNQINYTPDCIVPIARGGLTIAHFLAEGLQIREVFSISSIHYEGDRKLDYFIISNIPNLSNYKSILLVDDISDSGETLMEVQRKLYDLYPHIEIKTLTIFYKPTSLVIPHFKLKIATEWIKFFWER
ncbi:MAG: phosphoribosyltransferase [Epsilonproteobacteria bacterium]|nr:phosphoribosyltransferase [Campylobacterota bacterium]